MITNQKKIEKKYNKYNKDHFFMSLAFLHANRIIGNTGTNPAVGCIIVKNGCVVSSGNTSYKGRPHAEANALKKGNKKKYTSSSVYVSLEPCSHYGKTAPCSKKIVKISPKNVVYPILDYDFRSRNKSKKIFQKNKIKSQILKNYTYSKVFYKYYKNFKEKKVPFVSCKLAISKDFFLKSKKKTWITNEMSRGRAHILRAKHDSILTSIKTVNDDNPTLNCRIKDLEKYSPSRFILDKNLEISMNSKIVKSAHKYKTYLFYNRSSKNKMNKLKDKKIKLIYACLNKDRLFNLREILYKMQKIGCTRIFLEAGQKLTYSFIKNNLINDLHIFRSQNRLGSKGIKKVNFIKKINLFSKKNLNNVYLDGDKFYTLKIK